MDFILEHNDDPIPDPASVATATSSAQPSNEPINVDDEDEDEAAALRAAYGLQSGDASQAGSGAGVEARVSRPYLVEVRDFIILDVPEHQMFTVRQDIQKHCACKLSRGEERARPVRGVHRRGAFRVISVDKQFY